MYDITIWIILIPIIPSAIIGYVIHKIMKKRLFLLSSYYTHSLDWIVIPSLWLFIGIYTYIIFMDLFFLIIGLISLVIAHLFVGLFSLCITILLVLWSSKRMYALSHACDKYYVIKCFSPKIFVQINDQNLEIKLKSNIFGYYFRLEQNKQLVGIFDSIFLGRDKECVQDFLVKKGCSIYDIALWKSRIYRNQQQ